MDFTGRTLAFGLCLLEEQLAVVTGHPRTGTRFRIPFSAAIDPSDGDTVASP